MTSDEATVSLSRPWSILAAHWFQVAILTVAFALACAAVVWLNATYVARATLRTPDLTVSGIQAGRRSGKRCGCYFGACNPQFPRR